MNLLAGQPAPSARFVVRVVTTTSTRRPRGYSKNDGRGKAVFLQMTPAPGVGTLPSKRKTCTLYSVNVDYGRSRNRQSKLSEMVSSTTWICNWVILVKTGGGSWLEFLLAVFISSYWGMGGSPEERFQDGPSFYRHVRGIAAGGEGRCIPNSESGGGW
jgi:hypothetical protein